MKIFTRDASLGKEITIKFWLSSREYRPPPRPNNNPTWLTFKYFLQIFKSFALSHKYCASVVNFGGGMCSLVFVPVLALIFFGLSVSMHVCSFLLAFVSVCIGLSISLHFVCVVCACVYLYLYKFPCLWYVFVCAYLGLGNSATFREWVSEGARASECVCVCLFELGCVCARVN